MKKIIVATGNEGKMKEFRQILQGEDIIFSSLKDENLQDVEIVEDGSTFEENALIKARKISELTGQIVLADDSGLEVDALELLKDVEGDDRSARFVCVIACVFPDGRSFTCRGVVEGQIGYSEKGENGFGYDPIFYVPELGCTTAELKPEDKNQISHRGRALTEMYRKMKEYGIV